MIENIDPVRAMPRWRAIPVFHSLQRLKWESIHALRMLSAAKDNAWLARDAWQFWERRPDRLLNKNRERIVYVYIIYYNSSIVPTKTCYQMLLFRTVAVTLSFITKSLI